MTDIHKLFMVKIKKMIKKITGWGIFLVVYVIYGSLVYTDSKKTVSCLLPRLLGSYHIIMQLLKGAIFYAYRAGYVCSIMPLTIRLAYICLFCPI